MRLLPGQRLRAEIWRICLRSSVAEGEVTTTSPGHTASGCAGKDSGPSKFGFPTCARRALAESGAGHAAEVQPVRLAAVIFTPLHLVGDGPRGYRKLIPAGRSFPELTGREGAGSRFVAHAARAVCTSTISAQFRHDAVHHQRGTRIPVYGECRRLTEPDSR